jgi:hypothetical protein
MQLLDRSPRPGGMRSPRPVLVVGLIASLLLSACALRSGGAGATGVQGKATAGPTCPVERNPPDPACAERPVAGAVLVFTNVAGTEVARATSGADGAFSVELAPGAYTITAQPREGLMGTPAPIDVVVEAGQPMTEVQVSYDTGIR